MPSRFPVRFTRNAKRDLDHIFDYAARTRSIDEAHDLIDSILDKAETLAELPERGGRPQELTSVEYQRYRQFLLSPYRMIYSVGNGEVIVHLVADGRRDMATLLKTRLTRR